MNSVESIVKKLRESRLTESGYSEMDHLDLITLAKKGDQKAFEELLVQYDDLISGQARRYFLDNGTAGDEDIKQIATIAFWDAVKTYDASSGGKYFVNYAKMIINRKLADLIRGEDADVRKLNNLAGSTEDKVATNDEGGGMTVGDTISNKVSAEDAFIGREGAKQLMDFMKNNLTDTERIAIKKYIEGYKVSEISEETGMKYKSVENAIMRVKAKLAEYIKQSYSEANAMNESNLEFSEVEKRVLSKVLSKIDDSRQIDRLKESYENYTESQIDKEFDKIEEELEELVQELKKTHPDDLEHDDLLDSLNDLGRKLYAMEEYMTDEQYVRSEKLHSMIYRAEDTEYQPPEPDYDAEVDDRW